ncbi:MAG: TonB-dependent receptor [Gammaproteobacteria bacterium]|nr:TonB-dependent receptor [Gammaproteobacteria bacterium]
MDKKLQKSLIAALSLLWSCAFSGQVLGQIAEDETTVTYPRSYFDQYGPVTAKDMLDRIPGLGSTTGGGPPSGGGFRGGGGGGGGRGFGSGSGSSEILINGKRTAGKNNQTSSLLTRISADQVDYIQLIRGTSGELDVRGSGQVINIVTFEELSTSSTQFQVNADHHQDGNLQPGGNVSYTNQIGGLNMVLSAVAEPRYGHSESEEKAILGDFSPNDYVKEDRITEQTTYEFTSNLAYEFSDATSLRLNALYSQNDNPTEMTRTTTDLTVTPNDVLRQFNDIPGEQDNWEIGGDFEHFFDNSGRFKLLFVLNQNNRDSTRERYDILDDGTLEKNLFLDSGSTTEEDIIRSSYTMDILTGQNIEVGAERAITTLDSNLALGVQSSTGIPSDAVGGLVPVSVSNANSTVQETRYEPFVIHNWEISDRMSMESTLLYEYSEIEQRGDVSNKRDFSFVKPKVDVRYDVTPLLQIRGSAEKIVNQLRFSDFVAATDDQDEESNTFTGNANLRQEWLWAYNLRSEYRLPNDTGVVDATLFYHDHHDVIERIDVSTSEDSLDSANGNVGDGIMYGLRINASLRMRMINMPNLLVTSNWSVQDSKIEDAFTGEDRRFNRYGRGRWTLSFRHDVPEWRLNWGGSWSNRFDHNEKVYDIDEVTDFVGQPRVSVFAEWISPRGTSWRFDVRDLTNNQQCSERTRFIGRRSVGILEEIEERCTTRGVITSLKVTGTF